MGFLRKQMSVSQQSKGRETYCIGSCTIRQIQLGVITRVPPPILYISYIKLKVVEDLLGSLYCYVYII